MLGFILFEDRQVRLIGVKKGDMTASALHAEAEGLSWALKEMRKMGVSDVLVESDCQQLVRFINKPQEWPAVGPELNEFLCSEFSSISFNFIRRSDNVRADCLSKAGRSRDKGYCFVGDMAPFWLAHEADLFEPLAN